MMARSFYDLKGRRIETFDSKFGGYYQLFVRSEIFYTERRVVLGLWHFSRSQNGALFLTEVQKYHSEDLGLMEESYSGICIPKSDRDIFLVRKDGRERTPKIYFVSEHHSNSYDNKVDWLGGFLVKNSNKFTNYYQTNFFARRISSSNEARLDIVSEEDINNKKHRHIHSWLFR